MKKSTKKFLALTSFALFFITAGLNNIAQPELEALVLKKGNRDSVNYFEKLFNMKFPSLF